ncbi:hypothetical protein caldi_22540 [Caldinitratiruptor microaerophilus]|uniref:Uncharacterized protein n=1 Tax=Caldinitratiruptor microaerophilus TaxID=671077 RepID=A0AA35CMF1_9FIRM|nr:hypothetical protein caldi_22540 [Caldinitratiruptor microaerophilus]
MGEAHLHVHDPIEPPECPADGLGAQGAVHPADPQMQGAQTPSLPASPVRQGLLPYRVCLKSTSMMSS